ncbi:hypothetical protein D3C78_955900 [compost metagenome]
MVKEAFQRVLRPGRKSVSPRVPPQRDFFINAAETQPNLPTPLTSVHHCRQSRMLHPFTQKLLRHAREYAHPPLRRRLPHRNDGHPVHGSGRERQRCKRGIDLQLGLRLGTARTVQLVRCQIRCEEKTKLRTIAAPSITQSDAKSDARLQGGATVLGCMPCQPATPNSPLSLEGEGVASRR